MKKLLLLFVLSLSLFSCSDNSETIVEIENADLVGTWSLTKFEANTTQTTTFQGQSLNSNSSIYGKNFNFTMGFSDNPKTYTTDGSFTTVATTTVAGQSQTIEQETFALNEFSSGTWVLDANKLVFDGMEVSSGMTITSFDGTKLVFKETINETQEQQGASLTIKGTATIVLEKI